MRLELVSRAPGNVGRHEIRCRLGTKCLMTTNMHGRLNIRKCNESIFDIKVLVEISAIDIQQSSIESLDDTVTPHFEEVGSAKEVGFERSIPPQILRLFEITEVVGEYDTLGTIDSVVNPKLRLGWINIVWIWTHNFDAEVIYCQKFHYGTV